MVNCILFSLCVDIETQNNHIMDTRGEVILKLCITVVLLYFNYNYCGNPGHYLNTLDIIFTDLWQGTGHDSYDECILTIN